MKRREFSLGAAAVAVAGTASFSPAQAQAAKPREGKDYTVLDKRVPMDVPAGQIEVIEFFWYSCPHCNAFEPAFAAWLKAAPKDVVVKRVPVAFRDDFAPQQRLYYALEAMNKLDEVHHKVFRAIHVERQPLKTDEAIVAWAEKQGLDKARFTEAYKSFSVASKLRRAVQLQEAFRVEGVPSLGIAGRYYTDGSMAGSMERALQVTDHLIAEARKSR
jgi:protein dithiol oxidoreductase (disulfide-forming)